MAAEVTIDIIAKDSFSSVLGNFGNIVTGIKSAIDLAGDAFRAVTGVVGDFIGEAAGSELAMADLKAVLESTGGAAGVTFDELTNMATALQGVTRFSDETIMAGQGMLLTFTNIGADVFPMATQAMLDMGEKFGSVDSAAVQLGKALNDPINGITALTRVGVSFTDAQKEAIKAMVEAGDVAGAQKMILAELAKEFGGAAEAAGDTFAGKLDIARNKISDMKETLGNAFLPVLSDLMDRFMELADSAFVQDFLTNLGNWFSIAAMNAGNFLEDVINLAAAFADAGTNSSEFKEALGELLSNFDGIDLSSKITVFVENLDTFLADAINKGIASGAFREAGDAFGNLLMSVINTGTEGKKSDAITALGNALSEFFRGAVGEVYFENSAQDIASAFLSVMIDEIKKAFMNASTALYNSALNIGESIGDGMRQGLENAWNSNPIGAWIFEHIIEPVKRILGIASPSTVFMGIGRDVVQGLIQGVGDMWGSFAGFVQDKFTALLSNLSFENILAVLTGNMSLSELFGGSGGGSNVPYSPGGYGPGGYVPPTTTGGGTPTSGAGGNILNFYGPVYVGSVEELYCPSPHPIMTASSQSLLTSSIG